MLSARLLVNLWLAGFFVAVVLQTFFQKQLSSSVTWGNAPGWQREIAIWNIAIVTLILCLRHLQPAPDETIVAALALLSLLLGANHLAAAVRAPSMIGHWAGLAGNFTAVLLYVIHLMISYSF
jgi:hypothetical protein